MYKPQTIFTCILYMFGHEPFVPSEKSYKSLQVVFPDFYNLGRMGRYPT